uniref:Retrovirus-related Pol polyprotein from transposon TNT 1-94-like beta-barrel domain-containing protein n=2 Tax=Setaria italica TaxID=4555 RepID=K3ZNI4_SETIT
DPNRGRFRCPIYFDSGATVHVVGDVWMLQGYQVLAEPWPIAVADGHPLVVVGIGSISQEGFMIPNVFHVQGLKMNLISVSQLDRGHGLFSGFHDGMCKVLKRGGDVVGGGFLLANGLYELSFLEVPETETGEEAGSTIQPM